MKRPLSFQLAVAALTVIASIASANAQMTRVAIGYSGISADQLVLRVAKDTGIFTRNNIDAQPIHFAGGTIRLPRWWPATRQ
ncbi:MAG TPA: hypothetical protein VLA17_06655 [Candidatus Limnocylindria bacterium]|nr:hypothetical protein [Candidatus Limnocylindria bacterium]